MKRTAILLSALGLLSFGAAQAMTGMNHDARRDMTAGSVEHSGMMHDKGRMMMTDMGHGGMKMPMCGDQNLSPMHQELLKGMSEMHRDMHLGMMLMDADGAFAAGMIPHHQGAVAMAQVELKYGKDPDMRKLAQQIIDAQGPEIDRMKKWLAANPDVLTERAASHASMSPMHKELMEGMTRMHDDMMKGSMLDDPDAAFAAGMIPHHQGAVEMARIELKYGKDPDMKSLAQQIIDAQEPEIRQMRDWLARNAHGAK